MTADLHACDNTPMTSDELPESKKNLVPLVGRGHLHPGCGSDLMEHEIQSRKSGHKQNDEYRDDALLRRHRQLVGTEIGR